MGIFTAFFANHRNFIAHTITRVAVPLWIALGAGFKLYEHTPKTLPPTIKAAIEKKLRQVRHFQAS